MDIARSIDFDSPDRMGSNGLSRPSKHREIDVNRQLDIYSTGSTVFTGENPPSYQLYQHVNSFKTEIAQESPKPWLFNPLCPPNTIRSTRVSTQHQSADCEYLSNSEAIKDGSDDTTVLCELGGTSMDFTQSNELMPGKMGMVKGASNCIVRVTLRKKYSVCNEARIRRSVWVIADDGKTCIQHKLPQGSVTVPYTLWSNAIKVIIRHPTELRYFANSNSDKPHRALKTSWVAYTFDSVSTSAEFQSALLSPLQLIQTLPTTRTIRLHKSRLVRTFSSRLQLCGLENLRVFRDTSDPNSLVCMIHYSPNFQPLDGEEYIVFRLYPPPRNTVRIREDGESCVKIKGLDIRGYPGIKQKKIGQGLISQDEPIEEEAYASFSIEKIRIEFESGREKRQFLKMTRELQGLSSW